MDGQLSISGDEGERLLEPIRMRSLREQVHDELRHAIISGRIKSGTRLNERQLAADLAISTSPLKEAMRMLEAEGLVRTEPRRGSFVTFSARQAEEMTLARAALESVLARQAAKHGSERDFARLKVLIGEMQLAMEAGEVALLIELNEKFHDTIHDASGCEYLRRLQNGQRTYDHSRRVTVLSQDETRRASFHEHEAIMQAIASRNEDGAEQLMRKHIMDAGTTYIDLVFGTRT